MSLVFHEAALAEVEAEGAYYRSIEERLSNAFADELEHALKLIIEHPQAWQPLGRGIRRCLLKRFPFGVVCVIRGDTTVVIAVAHTSRRPRCWRKRLPEN